MLTITLVTVVGCLTASLCSVLGVHQMTVLAAAATGGLLVGWRWLDWSGCLEVLEAELARRHPGTADVSHSSLGAELAPANLLKCFFFLFDIDSYLTSSSHLVIMSQLGINLFTQTINFKRSLNKHS